MDRSSSSSSSSSGGTQTNTLLCVCVLSSVVKHTTVPGWSPHYYDNNDVVELFPKHSNLYHKWGKRWLVVESKPWKTAAAAAVELHKCHPANTAVVNPQPPHTDGSRAHLSLPNVISKFLKQYNNSTVSAHLSLPNVISKFLKQYNSTVSTTVVV